MPIFVQHSTNQLPALQLANEASRYQMGRNLESDALRRDQFTYGVNSGERQFAAGDLRDRARMSEGIRQFDLGLGENRRQFDATFGLNERKFGEDVRQFDTTFGEGVRRYDQDYTEGVRRFDTSQDYNERRFMSDDLYRRAGFEEGQFIDRRNFGYQQGRDQVMDYRDERDFSANRDDAYYGRFADQRNFVANRDDAAYSRFDRDRNFVDNQERFVAGAMLSREADSRNFDQQLYTMGLQNQYNVGLEGVRQQGQEARDERTLQRQLALRQLQETGALQRASMAQDGRMLLAQWEAGIIPAEKIFEWDQKNKAREDTQSFQQQRQQEINRLYRETQTAKTEEQRLRSRADLSRQLLDDLSDRIRDTQKRLENSYGDESATLKNQLGGFQAEWGKQYEQSIQAVRDYDNYLKQAGPSPQSTTTQPMHAPPVQGPPATQQAGQPIDRDKAMYFMAQAGGDRNKARDLAKSAGYNW